MISSYSMSFLIEQIFNVATSTNQESVNAAFILNPLKVSFAVLIFAPIVEEIVFRSAIFSFFKNNRKLQLIMGATLFGLIHVMSSVFSQNYLDLINVIIYLNMGFWFSYAYIKTDTIVSSMILHFLNNLVALIIMYFTLL